MKKLLVPVDFSEQSVNAFRLAVDVAKESKGTIVLLHVISLPVLPDSPLLPVASFKKQLVNDLRDAAEKKFSRMISEYNTKGLKTETTVVFGRVHSAILECIGRENVDLVVMGTKGVEGMREWIVGSNTEKIVRTSPVPLIAVKNYIPGLNIKNIVFPNTLDTERQEDLVMKVKALQHFFGAKLHITWVNTPAQYKPDADIRHQLEAFAKWFMLSDYTVNVFNYSDEESGIIEFTKLINGDLIAMGTHGAKGIRHLLGGSLAEDVVNHVHVPVWTYCTKSAAKPSTQRIAPWSKKAS